MSSNDTLIKPGETKVIVPRGESPTDDYLAVMDGTVWLGRNAEQARARRRRVVPGDRGRLKTVDGEAVYGHVPDTETETATIRRDPAGFLFDRQPRQVVQVEGDQSGPISTSITNAIETDNYVSGGGFDHDGNAYPYTLDPSESIEVLHVTQSDDVRAEVVTVEDNTINIPLVGGVGSIDWLSIDSVTFTDPKGTGGRIAGSWAGGQA